MHGKYQRGPSCASKLMIVFIVINIFFLVIFNVRQFNFVLPRFIVKDEMPKQWYLEANGVSTVVSYVLFIPKNQKEYDSATKESFRICLENVNEFIARGVRDDPRIQFVFSLIGDTNVPESLSKAAHKYSNVIYSRALNHPVDLYAHGNTMQKFLAETQANYFICLNCGARGPYFSINESSSFRTIPDTDWTKLFTSKLNNVVKSVGATISCEVTPHVQSYAIAFDRIGANIVLPIWSPSETQDKLEIIRVSEVGISTAILNKGFNIASMESRHRGRDFRAPDLVCDPEYNELGNSQLTNPTRCDMTLSFTGKKELHTPGCRGIEPCEAVFVKYGGEVYAKNLIAIKTKMRVHTEDTNRIMRRDMCSSVVVPSRPVFDIAAIFQNFSATESSETYYLDLTSTVAIVVRSHSSYCKELMALLWSFEAQRLIYQSRILVLVVPTEKNSAGPLKKMLANHWPHSRSTNIRVVLMDFPGWVYDQYGSELAILCSSRLKHLLDESFSQADISRHCNVNSPLHYLLVDIALYYVLNKCQTCKQIMVTNADNHYSAQFLNNTLRIMENPRGKFNFDVVMTNMVSRGQLLYVKAQRRHVDLGAYIVRTEFLAKHGISFLGALPERPQANDYHDADGYFIEQLRSAGARIHISQEFFFFHD